MSQDDDRERREKDDDMKGSAVSDKRVRHIPDTTCFTIEESLLCRLECFLLV